MGTPSMRRGAEWVFALALLGVLPGSAPLLSLRPVIPHRTPRTQGMVCMTSASNGKSKQLNVPQHEVRVGPLPDWLTDFERLLGREDWVLEEKADQKLIATCVLDRRDACKLAARISGLGFGGEKLELKAAPPLPRTAVRTAKTEEARARRHSSPGFFKKGTKLDDEGKVSLTPEQLALRLAKRVRGKRVIDATCGAGGNAIAFARAGCDVIAIDSDRGRLQLARHNARIYGVHKQIEFVHGDARELVPKLSHTAVDVLHIDPPWGVDYNKTACTIEALPLLEDLLDVVRNEPEGTFGRVLAKVPPSFDPSTTPGATPEAWFGHETGDSHRVKFLVLDFQI